MKLSDAGTDLEPAQEPEAPANVHTLSVYVNNKPGVLMRICQVFARRAYNIDSLVVSHGSRRQYSRMTIGVTGDPEGLSQIIAQVNKLIDVIHCIEHNDTDSISKELAMVKVLASTEDSTHIAQIVANLGGEVVDLTDESIICMIHGNSERIDWVLQMLKPYRIAETIRSGKIVIARTASAT